MRRSILFGAVVALVPGGLALAAKHASAGSYSGTTSERTAVSFTIVSHGGAISGFATTLGYNGKCGQGGGPGYEVKAAHIRIGAGGRFSARVTLRFSASVHTPGRITGKVSRGAVKGKVVQFEKGKPNRCYSETFTAHRV